MDAESKKITNLEGQFLIRYASKRWPFMFGDDQPVPPKGITAPPAAAVAPVVFKLEDISTADDQNAALRKVLRRESPILKRYGKVCFGPEENWKKTDEGDGPLFTMIDQELEVECVFDEDAVGGVYHCLYRALHPLSDMPANMGEVDELAIPLASKFGWTDRLREAIGLKKKPARAAK